MQKLEHWMHIVFWWCPAGHEKGRRNRCSDYLAGIYAIETQRYSHPVSDLRAVFFGVIIQILEVAVQMVAVVAAA